MTIYYWNRPNYRSVAHATEFRNAICGTAMGYGQFIWAKEGDRRCKRCESILAKREASAHTDPGNDMRTSPVQCWR